MAASRKSSHGPQVNKKTCLRWGSRRHAKSSVFFWKRAQGRTRPVPSGPAMPLCGAKTSSATSRAGTSKERHQPWCRWSATGVRSLFLEQQSASLPLDGGPSSTRVRHGHLHRPDVPPAVREEKVAKQPGSKSSNAFPQTHGGWAFPPVSHRTFIPRFAFQRRLGPQVGMPQMNPRSQTKPPHGQKPFMKRLVRLPAHARVKMHL